MRLSCNLRCKTGVFALHRLHRTVLSMRGLLFAGGGVLLCLT